MSQHVSDPLEETQQVAPKSQKTSKQKLPGRVSSGSVFALLGLLALLLLLIASQILSSLLQIKAAQVQSTPAASVTPQQASATPGSVSNATPGAVSAPFFRPDGTSTSSLELPANRYVLYQDSKHIFVISTSDRKIQTVYTPGYTYNQAVRPVLTSSGKLIYSGEDGIWLSSIFDQQPAQLAQIDADVMITSLAVSQDGKWLAWSTRPINGNGQMEIYAGPLDNPGRIWQQPTSACPCYRIFSFLADNGSPTSRALLLTNDRSSNQFVQYGLWSLDIIDPAQGPRQVLAENPQQGPLALPSSGVLLYSTYQGVVPAPSDYSVPQELANLPYANSLSLAVLESSPPSLAASHVLLPEQHNLPNSAQYHWVTTPTFSPDAATLAYVEFSSDSQSPYHRHNALYLVKINESGQQLQVSSPSLFITTTADLLELGPWLDEHIVTLYADGLIYALDTQSGALTALAASDNYLHLLGVLSGQ